MIEYRSLDAELLETIHRAFVDAFSEYEVPIDMPVEKLSEMLLARSFSSSSSLGCYDAGILVGFTLVGIRTSRGIRKSYDIATGIVRSHQRRGLAKKLFDNLRERLVQADTESFTLEVLENNLSAQSVYRDSGLHVSRKFLCYEIEPQAEKVEQYDSSPSVTHLMVDEEQYCSFWPSWQNSLKSLRDTLDKHRIVTVKDTSGFLLGYGVVHLASGSILQIGSADVPDREGIIEEVLGLIYRSANCTKYRYLNVEEGSWICKVLPRLGFRNFINQYEMKLDLK